MQTINSNTNHLLEETYNSFCPVLINYIYHKIGNYESARDLAQDTFLRLMDCKQMLREDTVKNMLFIIARNLLYDYLRRHYKKQEVTAYYCDYAVITTDETESITIANDLLAHEQMKLFQLSSQRRKVYAMNRFQGKTILEISKELCLSRRTVENHLQAGRREIRKYIRQCI